MIREPARSVPREGGAPCKVAIVVGVLDRRCRMESMMLMMAAASARQAAAVFRAMNRYDMAAVAEADAHAIDAQRGCLNAEGRALLRAAQEQSHTFRGN
jgi:hypothetical protein